MCSGRGKKPGTSGQMAHWQGNAGLRKTLAGCQKLGLLFIQAVVSGAVAVGQVRIGTRHDQTTAVEEFGQTIKFVGSEADATHSGVDFEVHGQALVLADDFTQGARGIEGAQSGGEAEANGIGGFGGGNISEDEDFARNPGITELGGLLDRGHRENIDATSDQMSRHRDRPMAIGVGFDHSAELNSRPRESPDFARIMGKSGQIDSRDRTLVSQSFCDAICHCET
jgi:hypothetical protein